MNFIPKHILTALRNNNTSLGEHPAFPPGEESSFISTLMDAYYEKHFRDVTPDKLESKRQELGKLMHECMQLEESNREALEALCVNTVNNILSIPSDVIDFSAELTTSVDTSNHRFLPEKTEDFTFDDVNDINNLTDEIYKRRLLNALVMGASNFYGSNMDEYVKELFKINPELPSKYHNIMKLNTELLFLEKDNFITKGASDAGKVDVNILGTSERVSINAYAMLFPILLIESLKGFFELSIAHGLPNNQSKANYVIQKADFKMAEVWDLRFGLVLWDRVMSLFDKIQRNIDDCGVNFFLMYISMLPVQEFNSTMQEIFLHSKKGAEKLNEIIDTIIENKEREEFDDYMTAQSNEYPLMDDEYFSAEELICDSEE